MSQEILNGLLGDSRDDIVKEALEIRDGIAAAGVCLWTSCGHTRFATIDVIAVAQDRHGNVFTLDLPGHSRADRTRYWSDRSFENLNQVELAAQGLAARIEESLTRFNNGYKVWVTIRMSPNDGRPRDIVGKAYIEGGDAFGEGQEEPYDPDTQR